MDSEPKVIVLTRVDSKDKDDAQKIANVLHDGNLSLFVRMLIKDAIVRNKKGVAVNGVPDARRS